MKSQIEEYDYEAFERELMEFEGEEVQEDQKKPLGKKKKSQNLSFIVEEEGPLLAFLFKVFADKSKTTVKSYLSNRQIFINGSMSTKFNFELKKGDEVMYSPEMQPEQFKHPMLRIVFEDDHLIIIDKKNGLLSMATDRERQKTAYYILSEYLKSKERNQRVFIVHRLDRETSGLMVFAKSKEIQHQLQQNWNDIVLERKYVAVVKGEPKEKSGVYSSYLAENSKFYVYSTKDHEEGELAVTHYEVLKQGAGNSLVELELETGKKNQIRVHMKDMGCSIIGDRKYDGIVSPIGRIALHARKIRFIHPVTEKEMSFDTDVPHQFMTLLKTRAFR
ncbi:MAG: RluA family pseudouridine synthase [Rikenellaceae bacterium]